MKNTKQQFSSIEAFRIMGYTISVGGVIIKKKEVLYCQN